MDAQGLLKQGSVTPREAAFNKDLGLGECFCLVGFNELFQDQIQSSPVSVFPQISHKMLTGTWEMGDIYNLWAEPEESILDLDGNTGFREEAERERIWGEAV